MKKKIFISILIIALIISCFILFRRITLPQDAIFAEGDSPLIDYMGKRGHPIDIKLSDEQNKEILSILLDIEMRRTLEEKTVIHHNENPIVIYATINHKSWTFIFGEEDCVYGPGILSRYKILNAEDIIQRINKVIECSKDVPYVVETYYSVNDSEYDSKKDEFTTLVKHYKMSDGTWKTDDYSYQYRLEITGRMNNAAKDSTFVFLSNIETITFDQAWKASGFSSNLNDYFDIEDAKFVALK